MPPPRTLDTRCRAAARRRLGGALLGAALAAALAASLAGCASLLPRSRAVDAAAFASHDAARTAFERIAPYRTTLAQLRDLGFDVRAHANVLHTPYPQWVAQLVPSPALGFEQLDVGIRDCIAAQQRCRAYEFRFGDRASARIGPFLPDFLAFRRVTRITGWRFQGVVLVRDDVVLFRNHGGESRIEHTEEQVNPLGPLQGLGQSVGSLIE